MALAPELKLKVEDIQNASEEETTETTLKEDLHTAFEEFDAEEAKKEDTVIFGDVIPTTEPEKIEEAPEEAAEEKVTAEAEESSKEEQIDCTPFCRTEEERASFAELSSDMQRVVEQRYKDFESDYQGKLQANTTDREYATELREAIRPYDAMIRAEGGSHIGAVENLLATSYILKNGTVEQKRQLVGQMAKAYDIDLDTIELGETYVDPQIQGLQNRIDSQEAQLTEMRTKATTENDAEALAQVNTFKDAVDEKGQLLRPHFLTISPQIKMLLDDANRTGRATSLEEAYDQALWLNPETAQKMKDGLVQNATKPEADNAAKVEAAKKAQGVAPGGSSPELPEAAPEMSMRDELSANWDKFMN